MPSRFVPTALVAAFAVFLATGVSASATVAQPNDLFVNAQVLTGSSGTVTGSTAGATKEAGEPSNAGNAGGHSIWYRWAAPASGTATIDLSGSTFDTTLGVYTGSSVSALTTIASNDDASSTVTWSRVSFAATSGTTYSIEVDGYNDQFGSVTLNWSLAGAPAPAPAAAPDTTITSGPAASTTSTSASFSFTSTASGATFDCALDGAAFAACTTPKAYSGLAVGSHTFQVRSRDSAGTVDPSPASQTWTITAPAAAPDTTITSGPAASTTSTSASFSFTSTASGATFDCALDGAAFAACTTPKAYSGLAVGSHTFQVRSRDSAGTVDPSPASQTWTITAPSTSGAPANDLFANAQALPADSGTLTGSTVGATKETGEPANAGNVGGHSIWYRWTPSVSGTASIDTSGSSFDTTLGVYTGTTVSTLTTIASNDDANGSVVYSRVSFAATAGTAYSIEVDGYSGRYGSVVLNWALAAAPAPSSDPVVVAAGDIHAGCAGLDQSAATAAIVDAIPGTVAPLGDSTDNGSATQFTNCYGPTWGRFMARTRPAAGNHEYDTLNATPYYNYFGTAAGDPKKGYYSYDIGSWHVVVLNSICNQIGGCDANSAQARWLTQDLAAHPASCTLAYFHHPLFTSTPIPDEGSVAGLWQALYNGGADVVLNAHSRVYERFAPQTPGGVADPARGIREFIVGTGGGALHTAYTPAANSELWHTGSFGVIKLTLHASSYDWQFVATAGDSFTDSGTTACH